MLTIKVPKDRATVAWPKAQRAMMPVHVDRMDRCKVADVQEESSMFGTQTEQA